MHWETMCLPTPLHCPPLAPRLLGASICHRPPRVRAVIARQPHHHLHRGCRQQPSHLCTPRDHATFQAASIGATLGRLKMQNLENAGPNTVSYCWVHVLIHWTTNSYQTVCVLIRIERIWIKSKVISLKVNAIAQKPSIFLKAGSHWRPTTATVVAEIGDYSRLVWTRLKAP